MLFDEGVILRAKEELRRTPVRAAGPAPCQSPISRKRTMIVVGREFAAINSAAFVIERRLNKGCSKLTFVESRMRALVKRIQADVPAFHDFLGRADVEVIRALGADERIFGDRRFVSRSGKFGDGALRDCFQRRRSEVAGVTRVQDGTV